MNTGLLAYLLAADVLAMLLMLSDKRRARLGDPAGGSPGGNARDVPVPA